MKNVGVFRNKHVQKMSTSPPRSQLTNHTETYKQWVTPFRGIHLSGGLHSGGHAFPGDTPLRGGTHTFPGDTHFPEGTRLSGE